MSGASALAAGLDDRHGLVPRDLRGADDGALERAAREAGEALEDAPAEDVLAWADLAFGDDLVVLSSMADAVVAHVASRVAPGISVGFLDTGLHFTETIGTRDAVASTLPVDVVTAHPRQTVAEQEREHGPALWERDPDLCCALRKVEPLARLLEPYRAWVTGLRRDESAARAGTPVVAWDEKRRMVKVNPIARWSAADVTAYAEEHGVLVNPLRQVGYASVGCWPCTRPVGEDEDERAGRWSGSSKSECGIHA